jgi:hypothetical protein
MDIFLCSLCSLCEYSVIVQICQQQVGEMWVFGGIYLCVLNVPTVN